jgi:hypothetical protein
VLSSAGFSFDRWDEAVKLRGTVSEIARAPRIFNRKTSMKKLVLTGLIGLGMSAFLSGCARPGEVGWTPAYTANENGQRILRNWDYDGKQLIDGIDYVLLVDQPSHMTIWNVR